MIRILSLGAGVQSSCVLLMSCAGVLPKLDHAIFADTQWEPEGVYKHLDFLASYAEAHGIPVYSVTAGNLRQDALDFRQERVSGDGKRHASIPMFVKNPDGSRGLIRRQCTGTYKIDPIERFIKREILGLRPRQRAPKEVVVEQWFGISAEEFAHRGRTSTQPWVQFRYPLVYDVQSPVRDTLFGRGFDRQDCLDWLAEHGYPKPPRSACIGCPFHNDKEWADMKANRPEEFADAVAFDHSARLRPAAGQNDHADRLAGRLVGLPFLHGSLIPLDMVDFGGGTGNPHGMNEECQGMCGV